MEETGFSLKMIHHIRNSYFIYGKFSGRTPRYTGHATSALMVKDFVDQTLQGCNLQIKEIIFPLTFASDACGHVYVQMVSTANDNTI